MTDITELTSVQKNANIHRLSRLIAYAPNDELRQMAVEVEQYTDQLIEVLEKAQKSNEFLKGQLSELANFNLDWDKLEASYDSWREIAAELLVAKERIAELESHTVKLPKPISVLHRREFTEAHCAIYAYPEAEVNAALDEVGIKWEAE
ncbi:TPA: hypothetical protein OTZ38_000331 [Klebsiella michiganensis]|nr:hypothetical protein [Klebsiella michiganensis]